MTNTKLIIQAPDPDRPPLIANIFNVARHANSTLLPIFPYLSDSCIVPTVSLIVGGEGRALGAFIHKNSVDEVAIVFSSRGSGIRTGDVFVGSREHLVGPFFDEDEADENLMVIGVTQQQTDVGVEQSEAMTYICDVCQTVLLSHSFATTNEGDEKKKIPGYSPALDTLIESAVSSKKLNDSLELRKCKECGHENPVFPEPIWGWEQYKRGYLVGEEARQMFDVYMDNKEGEK